MSNRTLIYIENKDMDKVIDIEVVTESLNGYIGQKDVVLGYKSVTTSINTTRKSK